MNGCVPLHVPVLEVSVCPCCGVPVITGSAVFDGGDTGADVTVAVCAEMAGLDGPPAFVAVTATLIVR